MAEVQKCIRSVTNSGVEITACISSKGLEMLMSDGEEWAKLLTDLSFAYEIADLINSVRPEPVKEKSE